MRCNRQCNRVAAAENRMMAWTPSTVLYMARRTGRRVFGAREGSLDAPWLARVSLKSRANFILTRLHCGLAQSNRPYQRDWRQHHQLQIVSGVNFMWEKQLYVRYLGMLSAQSTY